MSFSLTPTPAQHELVERTHRFAEDVVRPVAGHYDSAEEFPWPVLEQAAREGFYNPLFYRDLISDPTGLSLPLFLEELFWGCAGVGLCVVMPALALSAMAQSATQEQLLRWAPECFGEPGDLKLAALCVSEPQGGSDVRNLQTRAWRDGDEWVIDGHKVWIGNGGIADVHIVHATVDPEAGHRGHALFVVPGGTPGLELVRKFAKLGCRASHTAELRFNQCRVPADHLLGGDKRLQRRLERARQAQVSEAKQAGDGQASAGERDGRGSAHDGDSGGTSSSGSGSDSGDGSGGSATLGAFNQTRPMVAAQALGIARAALEFARDYAAGREAFGEPIIDKQGVAFPLADLAADIDAARLLTWRASWMAAQRIPQQHGEGSMAKLKASEVAVRATEQAVQVCGGWGYVGDFPVEKWYRDAKLYTIFEGTSEIQRLIIGRALAGTVGEPPLHHGLPQRRRRPTDSMAPGTAARSRATMPLVRAVRRSSLLTRAAGRAPGGFWRGGS